MPYPNEHSARLRSPELFDKFARENDKFGHGIHAIWGIRDSITQLQAIRFDRIKFTIEEAKNWLKKHKYKVIGFQGATKSKRETMAKNTNNSSDSFQPEHIGLFAESNPFAFASATDLNKDGIPTRRFLKDIIHTGNYTHPVHKWNLNVTNEKMDDWVQKFNKMGENGVDVEVVVDHREDAEGVRGYVKEMFREGDTLYCVSEMIGQKGIDLASTVKNVSILIDRDYKDGERNDYGEAISNISIVQQPIVSGQDKFIPIAASKGKFITYPIFLLSQGDISMDKELLKQLQEKLGIKGELTDENILELIGSQFDTAAKSHETQITELKDKMDELKGGLEEAQKAASKKPDSIKIDPNLAEQMGATATDQLNNLVEAGKLTPAAKDKTIELFIGSSGKRNMVALSLREGQPSFFSGLIEILKVNDPVELGEKANMMPLSRKTPGEQPKAHDPELTKEMVNQANEGMSAD